MKISSALNALLCFASTKLLKAEDSSSRLDFEEEVTHSSNSLRGSKEADGQQRELTFQICSSLPTDRYYHIIAQHSGMTLNVDQKSTNNGASLVQWPVSAALNDNWRLQYKGLGYYQIIAEHSQKAVNVLGAGKNNGNSVVQWDVSQGYEDDWCFVDKGSGFYAIYNRGSGKVLAVPNSSKDAGTKLIQWDFLNIPDQLWKLEPVCATLPSYQYFNLLAKHSNLALNVDQASTANGASLVQWPLSTGKNDNWRFESTGLGYYQFIAEHSLKGVNVLGGGKNNGDPVVQWQVPQGVQDDWCFIDQGSGYYAIINRGSGKALAIPNKNTSPGTKIVQWEFSNSVDQFWKLAPVSVADVCLNKYGSAPTAETCDGGVRVGSLSQLDNKPNDLLNTAFDTETPAIIKTRLFGAVPQDGKNIDALYNPVFDAFCFNEDYPVPSLTIPQQYYLYLDYKNEFDKVLAYTNDVSEKNNRVTNNRIPGMFLRMCFHDNSVSVTQPDFQDYIAQSIDPATNKWIGEARYLNTSGADASNLICPEERYHPNQNYDQTATRVLNSIQRNLKSKYKYISYADFLHNGCNAATIYLTSRDPTTSLNSNPFTFGRKDACYADKKCSKKYPLCGPTELLPGVALSVTGVNDWFRLRGMSECLFMALMYTHTTVDNMASLCPIKKLTCTTSLLDLWSFTNTSKLYFKAGDNLEYFSFFLSRGTTTTLPISSDDSAPSCDWYVDGKKIYWPMTAIDCTLGLNNVQKAGVTALANAIINLGHSPQYNRVDILQCALKVLGGKGGPEGGACDLIIPSECKSPSNHKFGGYYSTLTSSLTTQRFTIDPKCDAAGY